MWEAFPTLHIVIQPLNLFLSKVSLIDHHEMKSLLVFTLLLVPASASVNVAQKIVSNQVPYDENFGINEPFIPTIDHLVPYKKPFHIDQEKNYYQHFVNGSEDGYYRRSSCPAINILANRGYINRSGRDLTYRQLAYAVRDVWNFGDDNSMLVLGPAFALHGWPETIDLDMFNVRPQESWHLTWHDWLAIQDDYVQNIINSPAAPTRNDRATGENVNINMTLYNSLISFSSDGVTLSLEDMAKHHHLRHNQSVADNPTFVFGSLGALVSLWVSSNAAGSRHIDAQTLTRK